MLVRISKHSTQHTAHSTPHNWWRLVFSLSLLFNPFLRVGDRESPPLVTGVNRFSLMHDIKWVYILLRVGDKVLLHYVTSHNVRV